MSTLSIEKSRNLESAAPSATVIAKKPLRSVESEAERGAAGKTSPQAFELKTEQVTQNERVAKQERMLTLLSRPEGASASLSTFGGLCSQPDRQSTGIV